MLIKNTMDEHGCPHVLITSTYPIILPDDPGGPPGILAVDFGDHEDLANPRVKLDHCVVVFIRPRCYRIGMAIACMLQWFFNSRPLSWFFWRWQQRPGVSARRCSHVEITKNLVVVAGRVKGDGIHIENSPQQSEALGERQRAER